MVPLTRFEMIKSALEAFREPKDLNPYLVRSFYPMSEIGGKHPAIALLQSLLSEQEYDALFLRLYVLTGEEGVVLPEYQNPYADKVTVEVPLSMLYEQLEVVLDTERWGKLLGQIYAFKEKKVQLTVLAKDGTETRVGVLGTDRTQGVFLYNNLRDFWPVYSINKIELASS